MTTPKHHKIVFRGTFVNTPEQWSISQKFAKVTGVIPPTDYLDLDNIHADGIYSAITAYFNNVRFTTSVQVEEWRAYQIGDDGNMVGNPRIELFEPADYVRGTSNSKAPLQVTLCVTTVAENRGPARFGRWFVPGPRMDFDIEDDGRISVAAATDWAEASSTFAKDVSGAFDQPLTPENLPLVNISAIGAGTQQVVDHISVGRVYDTQRRRRNALEEDAQITGHIDW